MSKRNKKNHREQVDKEIETIIGNALASGRVITYAQASAIRGRSIKLRQESKSHPVIDQDEKNRQIELCWKYRDEGKLQISRSSDE